MLIRQALQVAIAKSRGVRGKTAGRDWIVRSAMGNRGFDDDDVQFFHRHTLLVPLAEIEGRSGGRLRTGPCRNNHPPPIRGGFVCFQLESDVTARNEFHLQHEGGVV